MGFLIIFFFLWRLHPLEIVSVDLQPAPDNKFTLVITSRSEVCGTAPLISYVSTEETGYWNSYGPSDNLIQIDLNIIPFKVCEGTYQTTIELTEMFIDDRQYTVLINDVSVQFTTEEMTTLQKIDSQIDALESVGASAERHVLWLSGEHPQTCNGQTFAVLFPDANEENYYRTSVFQVVEEDTVCENTPSEFLLYIETNLSLHKAAYYEIGDTLYRYTPDAIWEVMIFPLFRIIEKVP